MEQATTLRNQVEASSPGTDASSRSEPDAPPPPAPAPVSKLTIRGAGLVFDRDIPDHLVLRVMNLVLTGVSGSETRKQDDDTRDSGTDGRKESLAEFYRRAEPRKIPEKLATIGAYFQKVIEKDSFTLDDLRGQFRAVNEPVPGNLPRDLKVAQGAGWIAEEHDQRGEYFVTRTGLDAVEAGFSRDTGRKPRRRKRVSKSTNSESTDE